MKNYAICIKETQRMYFRHPADVAIESVYFRVGEIHEVATPSKDAVVVNGVIILLSDQNFCFVINATDEIMEKITGGKQV